MSRGTGQLARSGPLKAGKPLKPKRGTTTAALKRKATTLWGEYVHARDAETCQRCGRTDGRMNAHHVMVREFAMTRADPDNGVLLDKKCHDLMHDDPHEAIIFYVRGRGVRGVAGEGAQRVG